MIMKYIYMHFKKPVIIGQLAVISDAHCKFITNVHLEVVTLLVSLRVTNPWIFFINLGVDLNVPTQSQTVLAVVQWISNIY